ncbi:MAG: prephenate dehydrogenase [Planctomycetota bacterium]
MGEGGERLAVGVIGLGSFGGLLAGALAEHAPVAAFDPDPGALVPDGVARRSFEEVCAADVVVACVNLQQLGGVLARAASHLRVGALVCDVTSVKVEAVRLLRAHVPAGCGVLATHPLFGPQTVREQGLAGQRVAVCPVRISPALWGRVTAVLAGAMGLELIEVEPDEHDREMALVQALTHLVGHAAASLELPELRLGTLAYQRLRQLAMNIGGDSEALFEVIQNANPHAAAVRARFVEAVDGVRRRAGDELA